MGRLGVRWCVGDVSDFGFEALRLSIWGARKVFGPDVRYVVCVNSVPVDRVREAISPVPAGVEWRDVSAELPGWLRRDVFDRRLAYGVGWKLAPLQVFPDCHELALDNDVVLWEEPAAVRRWREDPDEACCLAEDATLYFGRFAALCGSEPLSSGVRGLPPGFDLEGALRRVLAEVPGRLIGPADEQGLQVAALRPYPLHVVHTDELTVCSFAPSHQQHLGTCGAHFVDLNKKRFPGRGREEELRRLRDHWRRVRASVYEKVGIAPARQPA